MAKLYYTPREVADQLSVSSDTIMRRIHSGELPAVRVSEGVYRVPMAAFERWVSGFRPVRRAVRIRRTTREIEIGAGERLPETSRALRR